MRYRTELIRPPKPGDDRYFGDVQTQGIIEVVLYADPRCGDYTRDFAKTLKAAKIIDTCRTIWEFMKTQVPYVLDKKGYQWIKSPGRLWQEKAGDCKSYSVFIASCLKNLGIQYGYRFASYDSGDPTPTHVYVYVPLKSGGEIILDAVWTGPFNTQKKFEYKKDYPMAKTYYLGTTGNEKRLPGVLKIDTPIEELTDGELDLLLMKQRLEIAKMNAGIGGIGQYDEAIRTVDYCIQNVNNPDMICAIGEALEEGLTLEEAINGIGKTKTERKADKAKKKKETGKTAAGRLLQKVGKGLKKAGKAVVKVVTAPMRLVAKGAMEIYLPKAAPIFLYLFIPDDKADKLPDIMKRKRQKSARFKNFVVKGLGMKEHHFMQIIENNLTKRYGKPPAAYLAEKLATRVSGVGNPKANWRREADSIISGIGKETNPPKRKQAKPKPVKKLTTKAKPGYNTTLKAPLPTPSLLKTAFPTPAQSLTVKNPAQALLQLRQGAQQAAQEQYQQEQEDRQERKQADKGKLTNAVEQAASGNLVGGIIAAVTWLISKITSLFGNKEKIDPIGAEDLPDVERDAANIFEYQDMTQDYSNLDSSQKDQVKQVATEAVVKNFTDDLVARVINDKLAFLNPQQKEEVKQEIYTGPEAIDESESEELAKDLDPEKGNNNTAIIALAAVAALALAK